MLTKAHQITVTTHTRPDGDAIGSSIAAAHIINGLYGKEVGIVIANSYPDSLDFILDDSDRQHLYLNDSSDGKAAAWIDGSDLIICLDCNCFDRTESLQDSLKASKAEKILIDHHLNPHIHDFNLCFSSEGISSTCEMLYWVILKLPGISGDTSRIPMHSLRALMAGMTTDTNNFANSVYPSTLTMASKMLSAGVDRDGIISGLYNRYRENRIRMFGFALKDKMTITPEGAAYIIFSAEELQDFDIQEGELEGLVNIPLGIDKVRMSILLKEDSGYFRVSVRSKKGTSANIFAHKYFNGGGHELASGGRLYFPRDISSSKDAEAYVARAVKRYFKPDR